MNFLIKTQKKTQNNYKIIIYILAPQTITNKPIEHGSGLHRHACKGFETNTCSFNIFMTWESIKKPDSKEI